jgi:hypothetical protein
LLETTGARRAAWARGASGLSFANQAGHNSARLLLERAYQTEILKEKTMKRILTQTGLSLVMALCLGAPAAMAKGTHKPKHSAEHTAAIKKCNEDYAAAKKDAAGKKGKERKEAMAAASKAKKDCIAAAPK